MVLAFARFLVRLLLRIAYRVEVRGHMQPQERLLIVANHQSYMDGVLLGAFLPVTPVWLVHTLVARTWYLRLPMRFFPHLVVDTSKPWALKAAVNLIQAGKPVLIFPEGRITVTGSLMKIYDGPAFVAAKTGAIVVPVHLDGPVYTWWSRMSGDFPRKWFPRIRIAIHPERTIAMPEARTAKLRRRIAGEVLRKLMVESEFASRPDSTIFPAFLDAMALHGRRCRMLEDVRQQVDSYQQILKTALALGRIVSRLAAEQERVGVLMPNAGATLYLLLGMFAMRRVPAILNYTAGLDGMQSACGLAGIRVVITSRTFLEKSRLGPVVEKLQDVRLVYLEDLRASFTLLDKLWLIGWALWFPRSVARPVRPEDPAVVLFTSGSEGKPKGVVLSHGSILANVTQLKAVFDFSAKDKFLSPLPLFHSFGLTVGGILPLLQGCRVFIYPSPLHYRIIPETVYDRDCTVLFATNTFLANYARFAHPYDFRNLRIVGAGAEKLTEDVRQLYFEKFGIRILEGYGATECSPVIAVNTAMVQRAGTVGQLLPGMEYRIEPVPGIEPGGVLHVRGPNVMLGYLGQPPLVDGWYNTGDVVSIEEGFVRILGRMRRFAKIAGEMVSLELVEGIAYAASPNSQHASTAMRDPARGEMILLFTEDPNLRREHLQQSAQQLGAPEIAIPRRMVHHTRLPLLGNGKKDYVALAKMADELQPAGRA